MAGSRCQDCQDEEEPLELGASVEEYQALYRENPWTQRDSQVMATENINFQLDHLGQNRGPRLRDTSIIISTLTTLVVLLRFCARRSVHAKIMADDYTILVALVSSVVLLLRIIFIDLIRK
jgi:hypothetical protein